MPTGSVRLQSIKKLGHENQSYEFSDEGNAPLGSISAKMFAINDHITKNLSFFPPL